MDSPSGHEQTPTLASVENCSGNAHAMKGTQGHAEEKPQDDGLGWKAGGKGIQGGRE
jgi:hypothetical protein